MTHDMFANGFSETQRAVLAVFRLAVSWLPRISCSAHKQGWISLSMIDCPSCWAVPSRYETTAGSRAINAAGDGKTSSHCWHKLVYHGISWYIVHAVALSEDWSSFATNFEVESLQKSHRSCQPVTYISQSWALDPIPDLNIIVSGSQLQGSYHSLHFVYPAKAVTSSRQTIYYIDIYWQYHIFKYLDSAWNWHNQMLYFGAHTHGIPWAFHGHIWAQMSMIVNMCIWRSSPPWRAAPPCFWVEPHGPSSPASSAEHWVLGWGKVGTEIRISTINFTRWGLDLPIPLRSSSISAELQQVPIELAHRDHWPFPCQLLWLKDQLQILAKEHPNSDSWRIGPHESIAA